jgi:flagellar motor switch protein FliM
LENIHTSFALNLSSLFSNLQREKTEAELKLLDQTNYSDFISSLSSPCSTYVLSMEGLPGLALLDFSSPLVFYFVDKMLGGKGGGLELKRGLTGIEKSILSKIMFKTLAELEKTWGEEIPLTLKHIGFESHPESIEIAPFSETVIVVNLEVKTDKPLGSISICYPYPTLEPVFPKLLNKSLTPAKKEGKSGQQEITERNLQEAKCQIKAALGESVVSIEELLNLKEGDIIVLEQTILDPIKIFIGEKEKFQAHPGISGKNKAFQITGS